MLKGYRKNYRIEDMLFMGGAVLIFLLYLWKLPLEIQAADEQFYLTIPKRLLDGDVFVVDEWHGSQFSAFLLLPLMWLNKLLFGYEGVVLHFRVFYLFFQSLCAVTVYIRLRRYGVFGALAALFLYLFTPYDLMALSYDTMGLMLGALTGVFLATAESARAYFAAGLFFAGAVLCCPYLLAGYIVYSAIVVLISAVTRKPTIVRNWLAFSLGGGGISSTVDRLYFHKNVSLPVPAVDTVSLH